MNRHSHVFSGVAVFVTALTVYGCDSKAPGADIVAKPPAKVPISPPTPPKTQPPAEPKTDLDRSKVPTSLQSDAYHYYSLSNTKSLDMEMTTKPDSAGVVTGSMSARMTQVDKDGATFIVETTGSLNAQFGSETVALKPTGLWAVSSDREKLYKPQLELPTGFSSGKPWTVDSMAGTDKGKIRQNVTYSCKGERSIKIGDTSYTALYVEGEGTFTGPGLSSRVVMKEWFVKDIGNVKMELVQTPKGKPPVTLDMVWKPTDSKAKS